MNAENLGNVVAKPQPNADGSLIYYETDKGYGVHIDATTGKLLQVHHKDTGARFSVDGIEAYDEPEKAPEVITVTEAVETGCLVEVVPAEFCGHPVSKTYRGVIVSSSVSYDGFGEPDLEEFTLQTDAGGCVSFTEWTYDRIIKL